MLPRPGRERINRSGTDAPDPVVQEPRRLLRYHLYVVVDSHRSDGQAAVAALASVLGFVSVVYGLRYMWVASRMTAGATRDAR